jgi:hypothetical protein
VVIEFDAEWEDEEAREALDEALELKLVRRGRTASLDSWIGDYDDGFSLLTWGLIDLFKDDLERPFSHLSVKVPRHIDLEIRDYVRGDLFIKDMDGEIDIITGTGDVMISDITGDLTGQGRRHQDSQGQWRHRHYGRRR